MEEKLETSWSQGGLLLWPANIIWSVHQLHLSWQHILHSAAFYASSPVSDSQIGLCPKSSSGILWNHQAGKSAVQAPINGSMLYIVSFCLLLAYNSLSEEKYRQSERVWKLIKATHSKIEWISPALANKLFISWVISKWFAFISDDCHGFF